MSERLEKTPTYFIFVCVVISIMTYLSVGSYESRLANSIGDDHPVVWARFISNPNFWKVDGGYAVGKALALASLPNLLASVTVKLHEKFPVWLSWLYIFIQNVGLALALFAFCRTFIKDDKQSLLITFLCFLVTPWGLNLAYYPSMMYSPYPGHLVMPFIVLASVFLVQQRVWIANLLLTPAALIHPSQTLHFVCLAVFYLLIKNLKNSFRFLWPLILPVASCFIIPMFIQSGLENPLTDSELMASALNNPHLVPWNTPIFWPWCIPTTIMLFGLSFVLMRSQPDRKKFFQPFWWANFLSFIFMALLHIGGVKLKILPIILLCPLRITVINSVLLFPLVIYGLLRLIWEKNRSISFTAGSLLMLILVSKRGLFWGPLLILALSNPNESKRPAFLRTGFLMALWWGLFILSGRPLREIFGQDVSSWVRNVLTPGFSVTLLQISIALSFALFFYFYQTLEKWGGKQLTSLMLILVIFFGIVQAKQQGAESMIGMNKSMLELQRWANTSTPKESIFLIEGNLSWRGISERRTLPASSGKESLLPYLRNREPMLLTKRVKEVYEQLGKTRFEELEAKDISILARELQGDYLVEESFQTAKNLPIVFENDNWRVYRLHKG